MSDHGTRGGLQGSLRATLLLLVSVFLIGVAHAAFLPPWEGFDEPAHWSSIQQIADTGTLPLYGEARLSRDVDAYPGPKPYASTLPFDETGAPTYRSFRETGGALEGGPTGFAPSGAANWAAQHGPLYYLALSPIYRLVEGASWKANFLTLRLASWSLAAAGLAIGVLATWRRFPQAAPIMAAWPFLFPEFFPEMARLGNDSLCLLLIGAAWALLLRLTDAPRAQPASAALLGLVLGLGLLTKAFFLPIGLGVGLFLLVCGMRPENRRHVAHALILGFVALVVGGGWYVHNVVDTGTLTGADEFVRTEAGAVSWSRLLSPGGLLALIQGVVGMAMGFGWAGTWSLAQPPAWVCLLPLLVGLVAWSEWLRRWRERPPIAWAPVFLAVPLLLGLVYHLMLRIASAGQGSGTPGWYLHILAPALGFALALGWTRPRLLGALGAVSVAVGALGWTLQLALFSGCATKTGATDTYSFEGASCFIDPHQLAVLGYPVLGAGALAAGVALALAALLVSRRGSPGPRAS